MQNSTSAITPNSMAQAPTAIPATAPFDRPAAPDAAAAVGDGPGGLTETSAQWSDRGEDMCTNVAGDG